MQYAWLAALLLTSCQLVGAPQAPSSAAPLAADVSPAPAAPTLVLAGHSLKAEIVDTPASRERGLSGRPSLAADSAMVFVWDQPTVVKFWMPDMNFPIDVVFVLNGHVTYLTPNAQPCASRTNCPAFGPDTPIDTVVEMNAGLAASWGLKLGDVVQLNR